MQQAPTQQLIDGRVPVLMKVPGVLRPHVEKLCIWRALCMKEQEAGTLTAGAERGGYVYAPVRWGAGGAQAALRWAHFIASATPTAEVSRRMSAASASASARMVPGVHGPLRGRAPSNRAPSSGVPGLLLRLQVLRLHSEPARAAGPARLGAARPAAAVRKRQASAVPCTDPLCIVQVWHSFPNVRAQIHTRKDRGVESYAGLQGSTSQVSGVHKLTEATHLRPVCAAPVSCRLLPGSTLASDRWLL
jgi:hypothetical protein